jgi:hypothetical protein
MSKASRSSTRRGHTSAVRALRRVALPLRAAIQVMGPAARPAARPASTVENCQWSRSILAERIGGSLLPRVRVRLQRSGASPFLYHLRW